MDLISKRHITRNVLATIGQVLVSGLVLFILYRYLLNQLGVKQIGVWSIVLAAVSVSRIGDFGLSAGVVKFVAQALARGERERAGEVVETIVLTLGGLMAIVLIAAFPLFQRVIEYLLPGEGLATALLILPYALLSLWATVIAGGILGGLDGCQRIDLRSGLMAASQIIYLGLTILWVPTHGLEGVARAQLTQSLCLVIASWWVLRRTIAPVPWVPVRWRGAVLRDMLGYGVNFQIISIVAMLFDPVTKGLMSKFGGLAPLGYYEMASKLVLQMRAVIVESNRTVVPLVARLTEGSNYLELRRTYEMSFRLLLVVSATSYAIIVLCGPMISLFWIGRIEETFVAFLIFISVGWFLNTLAGPAYFHNLGTGYLKWNVISHVLIGVLNLSLGIPAGMLWGSSGVVIAFVISLAIGSMVIIFSEQVSREVVIANLRSGGGEFLFKELVLTIGGLALFFLSADIFGAGKEGAVLVAVFSSIAVVVARAHWERHVKGPVESLWTSP